MNVSAIKNNRYLLALSTIEVRAFGYIIPTLLFHEEAGVLPAQQDADGLFTAQAREPQPVVDADVDAELI